MGEGMEGIEGVVWCGIREGGEEVNRRTGHRTNFVKNPKEKNKINKGGKK